MGGQLGKDYWVLTDDVLLGFIIDHRVLMENRDRGDIQIDECARLVRKEITWMLDGNLDGEIKKIRSEYLMKRLEELSGRYVA